MRQLKNRNAIGRLVTTAGCRAPALVGAFLLTLTAIALSVAGANAAEVSCLFKSTASEPSLSGRRPTPDTCKVALIKGTIAPGDSAKFAQVLWHTHPFLEKIVLWSPGGSVDEALKIGRLVRKFLLRTEAPFD